MRFTLKPIRREPNGPNVQLECGNCHQPESVSADWKYADANYASANPSYSAQHEALTLKPGTLPRPGHESGRELMAPVKFAYACAGCHSLAFDKLFGEGVPHDMPEVVHAFLVKKFSEYIAAHPGELHEARTPGAICREGQCRWLCECIRRMSGLPRESKMPRNFCGGRLANNVMRLRLERGRIICRWSNRRERR